MSRNWKLYLQDIIVSTDKIMTYVDGMDRDQFFRDSRTLDAAIRNLEIIGEATKQIPKEQLVRMPEIPWQQISGMRNILVHAYFGIDEDILWDVIKNHVPLLHRVSSNYLNEQEQP